MDSQAVVRNNPDLMGPLPSCPNGNILQNYGILSHPDTDIDIVKIQIIPSSQASLVLYFIATVSSPHPTAIPYLVPGNH